ncbi:MAG: T9SS type A sorting domain-containing protein [Paludibacter sp.]
MKKLLLSAALLLGTGSIFAQYYVIKSMGTTSPYALNPTSVTTIISGTSAQTNVLSGLLNLPFTNWKFYGNTVYAFKASTSGYITFDSSQTVDNKNNIALPSASAPKNAIFAFWDDQTILNLSTYTSDVNSSTYGSSPNRVFVVQWRLAQGAASTSNVTYYAIRLYEAGGFDIVENYGFGTFSATIGCQNSTGTVGTQVSGSPSLNFGGNNGSYNAALSDVYTFKTGTQVAIDAHIVGSKTPLNTSNTSVSIAVDATNMGSASITTANFNYSINGGATVSGSLSGAIPGSSSVPTMITHPVNFVGSASDVGLLKTVKVWLSAINGGTATSDTFTLNFVINKGITGNKQVLIEEGSGGWCGYCVDGHLILRDILAANPKVVGVVHHNSDGMSTTTGEIINTTYQTGYPYGTVDKFLFNGQATVGLNRGQWAAMATTRLSAITPLNISIANRTYNATTRVVDFDVKVDFVDYIYGDLRVNVYIVEDAVRGPMLSTTSTTWTQHSYYAKTGSAAGGASHELYNQPEYFYGYNHNHVVRNILTTPYGQSGIIPALSLLNDSKTQHYSYTLPALVSVADADYPGNTNIDTKYQYTKAGPAQNKPGSTKIVAFISVYNPDPTKVQILNVVEVPLAFGVGVDEVKTNTVIGAQIFPNPTSGITQVDFNLTSTSNVTVEIIDIVGKKVMDVRQGAFSTGEHSVYFDASNLNNGIYFVNIKSAEGSATQKFVVSK